MEQFASQVLDDSNREYLFHVASQVSIVAIHNILFSVFVGFLLLFRLPFAFMTLTKTVV